MNFIEPMLGKIRQFFRSLLLAPVHIWRDFLSSLKFKFLLVLCHALKPDIALTYNADIKPDGVGAQLQRVLAIRSLAQNLNLKYLHTPISAVAIHPLDSFNSLDAMHEFVKELNSQFFIQSDNGTNEYQQIQIESVSFMNLFFCILESLSNKSSILISCVEPYRLVESDPNKYQRIKTLLPNLDIPVLKSKTIVIHYRQGVGGKVIYPGQSISREIELDYFVEVIKQILKNEDKIRFELLIFTDAPSESTEYGPPTSQRILWEGTPRYSNGRMSIIPTDFSSIENLGLDCRIERGGNPLEAIQIMSAADHLVIGRSSLSYVAGILNETGVVYMSPNFWHKALPGWKLPPRRAHSC